MGPENMYDVQNRIIRNLSALEEHFIPSRLLHREGQLEAIRDDLQPLINRRDMRDVFLYGRPGTGKTCMARYVVEELKKHASVKSCYVNCWHNSSRFRVLYSILERMGEVLAIHRKGIPTDELLDILRSRLKAGHCIVILDEVDKLEEEGILYDLTEMERIGLILIANNPEVFFDIDARIRSRLMAMDNIEFPSYTAIELADILKDRAELGLLPNAIEKRQIEAIAEMAGGDARIAIDIMRISAEDAESRDLDRIGDNLLAKALPRIKEKDLEKAVMALNEHQRVLLGIVKARQTAKASDLYEEYGKKVSEAGIKAANGRTLRKYMEVLVGMKMIGASGEGRWREYSING
ncbi:MAG: AAA family ATPase [Candidatus Aenigmarchaeota archaeon]|nr:AAA family ATPase [Candidatus Aenigmarchaeota archaeon]